MVLIPITGEKEAFRIAKAHPLRPSPVSSRRRSLCLASLPSGGIRDKSGRIGRTHQGLLRPGRKGYSRFLVAGLGQNRKSF